MRRISEWRDGTNRTQLSWKRATLPIHKMPITVFLEILTLHPKPLSGDVTSAFYVHKPREQYHWWTLHFSGFGVATADVPFRERPCRELIILVVRHHILPTRFGWDLGRVFSFGS